MSKDVNSKAIDEAIMISLGLRPGETVELLRDRQNPLRIMLIRRTRATRGVRQSAMSC
jgi:hypothetical protein